jgi:hypothetical protein
VRLNTEQVRRNAEVNRGNFWLKLEEMSRYYDDVHIKLRPGGDWAEQNTGKYKGPTPAEMPSVEDYMGFFEHCKVMLDRELIDSDTFKKIFAYRLRNIVANPIIVEEKLKKRGVWWEDFIKLLEELEIKSRWYELTSDGLKFRLRYERTAG